jgi:hypothetical protein
MITVDNDGGQLNHHQQPQWVQSAHSSFNTHLQQAEPAVPLVPKTPAIVPAVPAPVPAGGSSSLPCENMCGVNAICRLILDRPVCGCPAGTSGDPSVVCRALMKEELVGNCEKHTDCNESEVCVGGKCSDPCLSMDVGCGMNAKCLKVGRTALCACNEGLKGNPYSGCSM